MCVHVENCACVVRVCVSDSVSALSFRVSERRLYQYVLVCVCMLSVTDVTLNDYKV